MAQVKVRIVAIGGRKVLQALQGLRQQNRSVNRSARDESQRTRRSEENDARSAARTSERAADEGAKATKSAEETKRREMRRTERERERSARSEQAREQRRQRRAREDAARGRRAGLRTAAGVVGGGIAGGGRAAYGVAQNMQSSFGIRSQMEILGAAVDLRQDFIRQAIAGGVNQNQIQPMIERAADIGRATGVSPEQVLQGISSAQERFSSLDIAVRGGTQGMNDFFDNVEYMARVSRATGTELTDVIGAAGEFQRQFGLDAGQTREAMNILAEGALTGSLTLRDFSEQFPESIATFQAARGTTGVQALREFQAIAQALRASGMDPRKARTRQESLLSALSNQRAQGRLRRLGINVRDRDGNLRSLGDIAAQAARSRGAGNLGQLQAALGNQEAAQALSIIRQQELRAGAGQEGAMTLQQRTDVDAAHGAQMLDRTMSALERDASGDIIRQRVEREAELISKSDELIASFGQLSRVLTEFEDAHPTLTNVAGPIGGGILGGAGLGGLLMKLGGGGGAAAAGGGGTAATGGAGAVGAGLLAPVAAIAAALGITLYSADTATSAQEAAALGRNFETEDRSMERARRNNPHLNELADYTTIYRSLGDQGLTEAQRRQATGQTQQAVLARAAQGAITSAQIQQMARAIGQEVRNATREPGAGRRAEGSPGR